MTELQSPTIGKIVEALAKAQTDMQNARLDSKNPHFKSDYASLEAVIDASKALLNKQGISVTQMAMANQLVTQLSHVSGEWIRSFTPIINEKNTCQSFGSGLSYSRRYGLAAIVCIGQSDDDGNEATPKPKELNQAPAGAVKAQATKPGPVNVTLTNAGEYVLKFGKSKGKTLADMGAAQVSNMIGFVKNKADKKFAESDGAKEFLFFADQFLRTAKSEGDLDLALEPKSETIAEPPKNWLDEPMPDWNDE